jgi:hypothetical protein
MSIAACRLATRLGWLLDYGVATCSYAHFFLSDKEVDPRGVVGPPHALSLLG